MSNEMNKDGLIRGILVVFLGIVLLSLVYNMFFQAGPMMFGNAGGGMQGMGMHGAMGQGSYGGGFSLSVLLAGILVLFIKILSILLIIGLLVGVVELLRKYLVISGDFSSMLGFGEQKKCQHCGRTIKGEWDYCSHCGKDLKKTVV